MDMHWHKVSFALTAKRVVARLMCSGNMIRMRGDKPQLKALSHLDVLGSVCRRMKNCSKTLAHVKYVMGKFCIR